MFGSNLGRGLAGLFPSFSKMSSIIPPRRRQTMHLRSKVSTGSDFLIPSGAAVVTDIKYRGAGGVGTGVWFPQEWLIWDDSVLVIELVQFAEFTTPVIASAIEPWLAILCGWGFVTDVTETGEVGDTFIHRGSRASDNIAGGDSTSGAFAFSVTIFPFVNFLFFTIPLSSFITRRAGSARAFVFGFRGAFRFFWDEIMSWLGGGIEVDASVSASINIFGTVLAEITNVGLLEAGDSGWVTTSNGGVGVIKGVVEDRLHEIARAWFIGFASPLTAGRRNVPPGPEHSKPCSSMPITFKCTMCICPSVVWNWTAWKIPPWLKWPEKSEFITWWTWSRSVTKIGDISLEVPFVGPEWFIGTSCCWFVIVPALVWPLLITSFTGVGGAGNIGMCSNLADVILWTSIVANSWSSSSRVGSPAPHLSSCFGARDVLQKDS